MKLIEVQNPKTEKEFLQVPIEIYKGDANWIRPLDKDMDAVFDKKKNKYFRQGDCVRYILKGEGDELLGRVAAFYDKKSSSAFEQPTGGMGFFECVDDQKAAFVLFSACQKWLESKGMEAMDGPINFGEKDKWWGLMVDGFYPPTYAMNYHHPYYRALFESYGFQTYYEQYNYIMKVNAPMPEKYKERAERLWANPSYRVECIDKKRLDKYAADFCTIYNKAWGKHAGFKGMSLEQAKLTMKTIKPVMEEDLIYFAYKDEAPIGFFIMLPELNQIFRHLNGNLNWLGKIKFLWYKWRKECDKIFGVAFGVVPEEQGKGVEGLIIIACSKIMPPKNRYGDIEMTWIGDFNPKMINVVETLGANRYRTYLTLRKLFDENREFKRAPMIR